MAHSIDYLKVRDMRTGTQVNDRPRGRLII